MEQKMGGSNVEEDCFPIGMRVLAVDDDPICLKILKTLLRKCEYHVTTTNQAITALRMLRENRNRYDLVISDVNMPDMDGFRLLELVGLEMDLPVIMLSAHSDTELVMKGITHGACDYLLKPVRIEEIRNIWQHVLRRKKPDSMDHSPNPDKADQGGTGPTSMCRDKKMKRKEKIEDAEEEVEDNGHENVDSSAQKKSRVIWSVELHGKFVAAVNQLGLDKAVPKKILDLMNVEELTREKVASHLQKYRLFLRKLRSEDSSHLLHTGSADSFEDFRTFTGPQRLSSASLSSYQPGGMLGRLNSSAALSRHGISSGVIQPGPSRTLNNPINGLGTFQPNQNGILFQGIPTSTELNQLSRNRSTNNFGEFNRVNDPIVFGAATIFQDSRVTFGALPAASGNPLLLQANTHQTQHCCAFRHQSSLGVPSLNQEPFDMHVCGSCSFLDHGRCNQNWQREVQLSNIPSNLLSAIEPFNHEQFPTNNLQESISWNSSHLSNSPVDLSSPKANSASLEDSSGDICHAGPSNNNAIQNMDYTTDQQWVDLTHDYNGIMNHTFLEGGTSAFGTRFRSNEDFPFENIP